MRNKALSRFLHWWLLAAGAGLATAVPAGAGTLCGTVRDILTDGPVASAGVFLRNLDWSYTGLHAASAADGSWCIDPVPAGTYHLDVRVDDYRIGLVRSRSQCGHQYPFFAARGAPRRAPAGAA